MLNMKSKTQNWKVVLVVDLQLVSNQILNPLKYLESQREGGATWLFY